MTRRSKREIERKLEELETTRGDPLSFAEFYEWYYYCNVYGNFATQDPTPAEYFGREVTAKDGERYWIRLIRVWDGDEEPPLDCDELNARFQQSDGQHEVDSNE